MKRHGVTTAFFSCAFAITMLGGVDWNTINRLQQCGADGDKRAVAECVDKLEAALKTEPNNQLARAYLGTAYTLRSRDLGFGSEKLQTLKHGGALMDEAVAAAPNDVHVRLVRAVTNQALPFFLGRKKFANDELNALLAIAASDEKRFDQRELQLLYYHSGLAANQRGDTMRAAQLFRKASEYPADATLVAKIKAAL